MSKRCYVCDYCEKDVDAYSTMAMRKLFEKLTNCEKMSEVIFNNDKEFCEISYKIIINKNKNILCKIIDFNNENKNNKLNLEKIKINTYKNGVEAFFETVFNAIDLCDYCVFFVDFIGNFSKLILIDYAIKNNKKIFFILNNCDKYLSLN